MSFGVVVGGVTIHRSKMTEGARSLLDELSLLREAQEALEERLAGEIPEAREEFQAEVAARQAARNSTEFRIAGR